jgi:cellulose synthase/poly-beta-1,6-N-acetylglucosamine synthase-like glycosyltransferase
MTFLAFWLSLTALIYAYAGFPLMVVIAGRFLHRLVRRQPITPTVSLIIAAYNEQHGIAKRLDNALALDYPAEALEIIVASDGSDDATESIVATYGCRGVRLLSLPRRGKVHALNNAVLHATGEILVFSDANSIYDPRALRKLVRNFADPEVGGVSGTLMYTLPADSESSSQGENLYWSYDLWIKQMESLTGSIVSANGAIYAVRREFYRPPTDSAVTDDFAISTGVVAQGRRLVFESEARAYEVVLPAADREFGRRVRLTIRGLRGVILRKPLLNPFRHGFYSLVLFSHKVLRRIVPFILLTLFVATLLLNSNGNIYLGAAVFQTLFYSLASVGYLVRRCHFGQWKCFYIPFYYCMANAAAAVAIIKLICGEHIELWQPQRHGTET